MIFEASKWIKLPMLIDERELRDLFQALPAFEIFPLGGISEKRELPLSQERLIGTLQGWIDRVKEGESPLLADLKQTLTCAFSSDRDALFIQEIDADRALVKIRRPVVQMAPHFFSYDPEGPAFHSMSFGKESVFWGIQFAYPQIVLDPERGYCDVDNTFANTALFQTIRRWSRDATRATPFLANGKKVCAPMRLGKTCFSWIQNHAQLKSRQLEVVRP